MRQPTRRRPKRSGLPLKLKPLFWEYDFRTLSWEADRDLVIQRVLGVGSWETTCWLRQRLGDAGLREWLLTHRGGGLDPRRLRFWEVILKLPRREVDAWVAARERSVWHRRRHP